MYRLAICEDEAPLREELRCQCGRILDRLGIEHEIAAYPCAEALEKALTAGERFDLLCLDILLTGKSGMEFARELRQWDEKTGIVFITGSTEYLLEGYSVRPLQYLLKPVSTQELEKTLRTDLRLRNQSETVTVQAGGKTAVLRLSDIRYIESRNHGVIFHNKQADRFFWMTLTQLERLLPPERFCRCHNSYLVNLGEIREASSREVCLIDGAKLAIGHRYAEEFQRCLIRYLNRS